MILSRGAYKEAILLSYRGHLTRGDLLQASPTRPLLLGPLLLGHQGDYGNVSNRIEARQGLRIEYLYYNYNLRSTATEDLHSIYYKVIQQ